MVNEKSMQICKHITATNIQVVFGVSPTSIRRPNYANDENITKERVRIGEKQFPMFYNRRKYIYKIDREILRSITYLEIIHKTFKWEKNSEQCGSEK